jgi:tetratricopeptide (TPR) repeat protein
MNMKTRAIRFAIAAVLLSLAAACVQEGSDQSQLDQANRIYAQGFYLEAEALYERFLQNNPQHDQRWQVWIKLLEIADVVRGDQERAISIVEAMLLEFGEKPDKVATLLLELGRLHKSLGHWEESVEAWHRVAEMKQAPDETRFQGLLKLSMAYKELRHYDLAQDTLHDCIDLAVNAGDKATCKYELAQVHTMLENWPQAREHLEDIVDSHVLPEEQSAVAAFLLADVLLYLDEEERAAEILESILYTHPNPKAVEAKLEQLR